jgi:Glycosyl hydrolase family 20, domain 2/Glycosyl hydrolase family 20, catalytic domain
MIASDMVNPARQAVLSTLLPKPKRVSSGDGLAWFTGDTRLTADCVDRRVGEAAGQLVAGWGRGESADGVEGAVAEVRVVENSTSVPNGQGYRLLVKPDGAVVVGGSTVGCFYGLQTLGQLVCSGGGAVPCCEIEDEPDFETRGLLHDITRGKVPTLDTLKLLVDRLALLKCNQLQLNIEHAFVFSFDPDICDADSGITPEEVRELDAYCRDRFIDLVPALANLGHMGRVLSMPKYRHLAEVAATESWEKMSWPKRLRGFTLDVMNPDAHALVARMWSDVLDAFSSPIVNICGDEPWDLGKGKNAGRIAPEKIGEAYIEHIRRVAELCTSRGRMCQAWSDVVVNYPELFHRLPPELTVLHWAYEDRPEDPDRPYSEAYVATRDFVGAGVRTMVCPAATGWKRIINAMSIAENNIASFARAGAEHGASGLLNTDWGDLGHFNQLACSWHGIAMGAACGWDANHPIGEDFDKRFAKTLWCMDDPAPVSLLREVSSACGRTETWRLLHASMDNFRDDPTLPTAEQSERISEAATRAASWFEQESSSVPAIEQDFGELAVAARFVELFADRVALACDEKRRNAFEYERELRSVFRAYSDLWRKRNKPAGLGDVADALCVEQQV